MTTAPFDWREVPHHEDRRPRVPGFFGMCRRALYFLLGVALIMDAVIQSGNHVAELVAGLVLLGLIPADLLAVRMATGGPPVPG